MKKKRIELQKIELAVCFTTTVTPSRLLHFVKKKVGANAINISTSYDIYISFRSCS